MARRHQEQHLDKIRCHWYKNRWAQQPLNSGEQSKGSMREAAKELAETDKRQGAQDDCKQWLRAEAVAALLTLCSGNVTVAHTQRAPVAAAAAGAAADAGMGEVGGGALAAWANNSGGGQRSTQDAAVSEAVTTAVAEALARLYVVNAARQEVERLERESKEAAAQPAADSGRGDAAGQRGRDERLYIAAFAPRRPGKRENRTGCKSADITAASAGHLEHTIYVFTLPPCASVFHHGGCPVRGIRVSCPPNLQHPSKTNFIYMCARMSRAVAPAKDRRGILPLGQTLPPAGSRARGSERRRAPGDWRSLAARLLPSDHQAARCLASYGLPQLLLHLGFHALSAVLSLRS
jgi:hypothetical protein